MVKESQKRARDTWDKNNIVVRSVKFFKSKSEDMAALAYYDAQTNKFDYIKGLIIEDMKKKSK